MRSYSLIFVLTICATVSVIMSEETKVSPTPKEFFKSRINGELAKISWAHGVNDAVRLAKLLSVNDTTMMLEADVMIGSLTNDPLNTQQPIMSHSLNKSDLTLSVFLMTVENQNNAISAKKGIKLDFKTYDAFQKSTEILKANMPFPVFLNADVLRGPNMEEKDEPKPVDPIKFLDTAKTKLSKYFLSLGWTTKMVEDSTKNKYEKDQLDKMVELIKKQNVTQMVTYPVRASMVVNTDIALLKDLLKKTTDQTKKDATLTIWCSDPKEETNVDKTKLKELIKTIGKDNVYLDLSKDLQDALTSAAADHLPGIFVVIAMIAAHFFYTTL